MFSRCNRIISYAAQFRCFLGLAGLSAAIASAGGCSSAATGSRDALNLRDPDAKFMKQVEKDPFPRAGAPPPSKSTR